MNKTTAQLLKNKEAELLILSKETAEKIKKLSETMNVSANELIKLAVELAEKAAGRKISLYKPDTPWEILVHDFEKFPEAFKIDDK